MSTTKHTAEPWRISEGHDFSHLAIVADVAVPIAHISNWLLSEQMRANAARIVACVNACQGVEDPTRFIQCAKAVLRLLEDGKPLGPQAQRILALSLDEMRSNAPAAS